MRDLNSDVILRIVGGFVFLIGLSGLFGLWKRWYWRSKRSAVYGYPLLGAVCILVSLEDHLMQTFHIKEWILIVIYMVLLAGVVWFSYSTPEFIKPGFVRRIELEPEYVYQSMVKIVMKDKPWRYKAKNKKNLEKWIREIKKFRK